MSSWSLFTEFFNVSNEPPYWKLSVFPNQPLTEIFNTSQIKQINGLVSVWQGLLSGKSWRESVLGKNAHAQIENTTHFKGQYKVSD